MTFEPTVLDEYRGYAITTRITPGTGVRILRPNGNGILNFAASLADAYTIVDTHLAKDS